jgi:tRNA (cmo5U34)-methyltransferase
MWFAGKKENNMAEFTKSKWADPNFSQGYRDSADIIIVERKRVLSIIQSFYMHFIFGKPEKRVLDLGCGDGIIVNELLKVDISLKATLLDGSHDMIIKAKERLKGYGNCLFLCASFQDILNRTVSLGNYDLIISSMATHHLTMDEKTALFRTIYSQLNTGGYFLDTDVILSPSETLEKWYLQLWREWINEREAILKIDSHEYDDIIKRYKDNTDNKPDLLSVQLESLRSVGFRDVDCYYKYGIFSIFGGKKQEETLI